MYIELKDCGRGQLGTRQHDVHDGKRHDSPSMPLDISELDRDAINANQSILWNVTLLSEHYCDQQQPTFSVLLQQTGLELHWFPDPMPMTLTDVQSSPISASTPCTTIPRRPSISLVAGSLAYFAVPCEMRWMMLE